MRERDPPDAVERAAQRPGAWIGPRRAADLLQRELLDAPSVPEQPERAVARGEVRRGVEGGRAREPMRIARDEQEHLLAAHAAADGIHAAALDAEPRERALHDRGHPREVGDLSGIAPRVERQHASLSFRVDDREAPDRGQVSPQARVRARGHAAAVRRHDERQPRIAVRSVPARQHDVGVPQAAVVRAVRDRPRADELLAGELRAERGRRQRGHGARSGEHARPLCLPKLSAGYERDATSAAPVT